MKKLLLVVGIYLSALLPMHAQAPTAPAVSLNWLPLGKVNPDISATSSSAATALPAGGDTAWVLNSGSNDAYVAVGSASATASATASGSTLVKAGTCANVSRRNNNGLIQPYLAAISAAGTTLKVETGIGSVSCSGGGGGGSTTANQGTAGSNAQAWWVRIGDATNGPAAVKAASTAPVAADPALVVTRSPNVPVGYEFAVANTPTVQNAAYSSGNAIGGLQTLSVFRLSGGTGILNNVSVWSRGGSTTAITLYIFNANPSASTCTDKSAFALNAADISKLIAVTPPVLTPAIVGAGTTGTNASQQTPVSIINGESTQSLYACAVVGGTVTPASTTDLIFKFAGVQD